MLNSLELTGRAATHVEPFPSLGATLHNEAGAAAVQLRQAALAAGFELEVVSGFRDFERQQAIWNAKYRGERPLLDRDERPLQALALDERARIDAILLWSALPGASRHHWGSDMDVIDRAGLTAGEPLQLTAAAYAPGGPCYELGNWLAANMERYGFFRPYTHNRGGVQPEPWHLSYAPLAVPALSSLTPEVLEQAIAASSILGREHILARLPQLHASFVQAVSSPPTMLS